MFRVGIGQDSHAFEDPKTDKPCIVGGLVFDDAPGLAADSDGDVIFHAICNAISSITHVSILGEVAPRLCREGVTNSKVYVEKALETLGEIKIAHIALSIEGQKPRFQKRALEIRQNVASILQVDVSQVGITFTSGDALTAFGKGEGLQCLCILSTRQ